MVMYMYITPGQGKTTPWGQFFFINSIMLLAKFQDHRILVLEKIFKVFTIYGHGGHLGNVTWTIYINFPSPFPKRLHIKFGFDWPSSFRGEDV